jgi:hypothetical protein
MGEHQGEEFRNTDDMIDHLMEHRVFRVKTEALDEFPHICAIAYAARRCHLVVEESQRVLPSGHKDLPPSFKDVVYRGRHRRVSLVLISQRASTIHIAARSQWSRLIIFNQTEPADVGWLLDTTGFELNPSQLHQSHYYDVRPGGFDIKILASARPPLDTERAESDTLSEDETDSLESEGSEQEWESGTSSKLP